MKLKLHHQIFLAMAIGIVLGLVLGEKVVWIEPIGDVFLRLLKMIIMPLVFSSIVVGMMGLGNIQELGRIGKRTFLYYFVTTFFAVSLGLLMVNVMKPGLQADMQDLVMGEPAFSEAPSIQTIFLEIIPENIFHSLSSGSILPVIFFAIFMGIVITSVRERVETVASFFEGLNVIMMKMTDLIMLLAPYGVGALMAEIVGTMGLSVFKPLFMYVLTVVLALAIHAVVILPAIFYLVTKKHPFEFVQAMSPALATAFSTASSAATLPITLDCLQKRAKVSSKTTDFVIPLGATVNMDGTALYEAVAAIFIAQIYGIDLSISQQIIIAITATLSSIGAAAIPGAGLVTMIIVLNAVNLPVEGIGLILAVDRVLDMCRTCVNVWGDSCGAKVIDTLDQNRLSK